jgi:glutaredoxin
VAGTLPVALRDIVLYTRQGCHLCHQAEQLLASYGLRPRLVDIDDDPELRSKFDTCVPVIEIDGQIRFRGRINEVLLRRLINAQTSL